MPQSHPDHQPDSFYGIICDWHGKQGLTPEQYHFQLMQSDIPWRCPCCRSFAAWDDARYEARPADPNATYEARLSAASSWDEAMPVIQDAVLRGATLVMNHTLAEAFWQAAMETEATHLVKIKELPFLPDGVVLCVDPDVKLEDVLRDEGFDFDLSSIQPNTDLN